MKTSYDWSKVDPLIHAHMAEANEAVKDLNKGPGFYAWLRIGRGLLDWRNGAMALSGSQDTDAQAYRDAWRAASLLYPNLALITDKSERSYSIWMWENHEALEVWHAGLSDKQRRAWNHPRTVWNHSPLGKATKEAQRGFVAPRERTTATRDLHEVTERIQNVADQIERTTGGAVMLIFDMAPELIGESARNFVDIYGEEDTQRFIVELTAIVKPPVADGPALDPAFAGSLNARKKRTRRPSTRTSEKVSA
jgi:hypothetical protein